MGETGELKPEFLQAVTLLQSIGPRAGLRAVADQKLASQITTILSAVGKHMAVRASSRRSANKAVAMAAITSPTPHPGS